MFEKKGWIPKGYQMIRPAQATYFSCGNCKFEPIPLRAKAGQYIMKQHLPPKCFALFLIKIKQRCNACKKEFLTNELKLLEYSDDTFLFCQDCYKNTNKLLQTIGISHSKKYVQHRIRSFMSKVLNQ